ncbi:hypothetical protein GOV12_07500 [Candidatus Pacearchaeota archaeon]|nr:hypothetical protein [Candidatus Pacearchaeota archaeon]
MGFFDFLKKKKEESVVVVKKISISQISDYIKEIKSKNYKDSHEVFLLIKTKQELLTTDLKEKISNISNLNLSEKKVEDRVKFIVKENLDHYLIQIEKFIIDLNEIQTQDLNDYVKNIDDTFFDFNKKSKLNYEKATYIIGKELGQIKESIDNFFKDMKNILNNNKVTIDKSKSILVIESYNSQLINISNNEFQIKEKINKLNENIKKNNTTIDIKDSEIKEIKKSIEYESEQKLIENKDNAEIVVNNYILDLKKLIDFKKLANLYHNLPKTMDIINKYKNNFKENFLKDNGVEILELIDEAHLTDSHISKQITLISNKIKKNKEIYKKLNLSESDKINQLSEIIKNLKFDIDKTIAENSREEKKLNKVTESKNNLIKEIKPELQKLNTELDG